MSSTPSHFENHEVLLHGKVRFRTLVMSPSATDTDLQVVCFPDQRFNQTYGGGTELVDAGFGGALRALRSEDVFRGERLETLLLQPERGQIPARRLLLVGLGDPAVLTLETITAAGRIAAREAIKLGIQSFCFAPSLKDAGLSLFDASDVSVALAHGMKQAISHAKTLHDRGLHSDFLLEEVIFLAGAQHAEKSLKGLRTAFGK